MFSHLRLRWLGDCGAPAEVSAGGGGGEDLGRGGGRHEALVLGPGAGRPRREAELQPEVGGVARLLVRVLASLRARVQHEALVQQTRGRPERDLALGPGKIFLEAVNIFWLKYVNLSIGSSFSKSSILASSWGTLRDSTSRSCTFFKLDIKTSLVAFISCRRLFLDKSNGCYFTFHGCWPFIWSNTNVLVCCTSRTMKRNHYIM